MEPTATLTNSNHCPTHHKTFGRSGQIRSQRSCMPCASRFGQSPFSCSFHFIMLALRPHFSMSLRNGHHGRGDDDRFGARLFWWRWLRLLLLPAISAVSGH